MKTRRLSTCLLVAALTLGAPLFVRAADDAKPAAAAAAAARPNVEIARLKTIVDELKLTGDTKTKVETILTKAQSDIDDATKEATDRTTAAKRSQQIVAGATEQIQSILDEDQKLMFRSKIETAARGATNDTPAATPAGGRPGGAPGAGRGPVQIGQRLKEATANLGLSDEQSKKIDAAIADLQQKAQALIAAGPSPETREKITALREDGLNQIKAILTEEQFAKFQEAIRQAPAGAPGAGGRLGQLVQRFQEALKDLNLTEEQKPKVQAAFADARKKLAELAPQPGQPTPETREKFRAAMEELRSKLTEVLTPEQQEKFRTAMQQAPTGAGAGARPRPGAAKEKPADK
jgi:Spy/CpxP family protein refolding chaperone